MFEVHAARHPVRAGFGAGFHEAARAAVVQVSAFRLLL